METADGADAVEDDLAGRDEAIDGNGSDRDVRVVQVAEGDGGEVERGCEGREVRGEEVAEAGDGTARGWTRRGAEVVVSLCVGRVVGRGAAAKAVPAVGAGEDLRCEFPTSRRELRSGKVDKSRIAHLGEDL